MSRSRRSFFRQSGQVVGGVAGLSLASMGRARGDGHQAPDPTTNCSPYPPPPATPIIFSPDALIPVRTRQSAFNMTADRINQLRLAYQRLRALSSSNPNDPRGWLRQANVHCWYCGGEGNGTGAGPEVHGSWRFLPWHRMYLYFHERILGELVGDSTLTLPFWDWDTPGHDRLPPIYADPGTVDNPNSLFDRNRGAGPENRIPASIVGAFAIQSMLSPISFEEPGGFGGTQDGDDSSAGTLENSPHGPVHIWTGDPSMQAANPDMGVLATAARDPLFFAHHANIDRLWDVWLNRGQGRANPRESSWLIESFGFYDQSPNPQWVSMSISNTVDHEASLRYTYEGTPNPASTRGVMAVAFARPQKEDGTIDVSPQSRETIKVPIPAEPAAATREVQPPSRGKPVYVLHIQGIEIPPHEQTFLRVFIDQPDANAQTPITSAGFVGQFAILATKTAAAAAHQGAGHKHRHNKAFILTDQQASALKGKQNLDVKLVAVGGKLTRIPYKKAFLSIRYQ